VRDAKRIGLRNPFLDLPIVTTDDRELFLRRRGDPERWQW
jgi:hypothetical protein